MVLKQHFQMKKWKERTCIRASLRLWVWVCMGVRERERERERGVCVGNVRESKAIPPLPFSLRYKFCGLKSAVVVVVC